MSHVLIVEDEAHLARGLRFNLEAEGHTVQVVGDGESALSLLLGNGAKSRKDDFDAVVLDVMLPGKSGFAVVTELRAAKQFVPVLMLTARSRPEDVLEGFAAGADDYLPKPFELPILLARLQGLLRRREWMRQSHEGPLLAPSKPEEYAVFKFSGRTIDFGKLELEVNGTTTRLTLMESELLRHLVRNRGKNVSRKSILEEVWGLHEDTDTRAVDNFIVRLRRYIEDDPSQPKYLLTVRGVGYRFVANPSRICNGRFYCLEAEAPAARSRSIPKKPAAVCSSAKVSRSMVAARCGDSGRNRTATKLWPREVISVLTTGVSSCVHWVRVVRITGPGRLTAHFLDLCRPRCLWVTHWWRKTSR